jgi:NADPH:quinone reductase-like Zn-dependent oxidoreductase/NAD(P)-dependent dehydrogenase (short-subunit alcohol dehydrogenase family)/acyl carrier protein
LTLRLLDLPPDLPASEQARLVVSELSAAGAESEIVWTPAGRHVPRLRRGLPPVWARPTDALIPSLTRPGRLDRLGWALARPNPPGPGEIEIEVHAAGVNFRDVMWATGALPEEALIDGFAGAALGLECAGTVRAVGPAVDGIAVGDRVAGFAPSALASRVVTRADAVMAIPPEIDFRAAATLPVAFVTARYALDTLARLQPGEHVLIHAASGAVGLAAIQIAKGRGATVIATAGSATKRAFLRLVGADHVCSSRELGFVETVRSATGGAGVDVVLNSLHGEAMAAGIELLRPFGRFVELGKRDFFENRPLRLRGLRQNISYFAVDIDQLPIRRPELAKALLADLAAALVAGEIRPLAHRCFAFAEIADALRLMQSADHIGKLVLVPQGNAGIALPPPADFEPNRDGVHIVTGGLGGFGFAAARWLVQRGARTLALIGRRGMATPGIAERVAELEAAGAVIGVHAADVADADSLTTTLAEIRRAGRPICGIVHAAASIVDMTADRIDHAAAMDGLRAKLGGALLLDRLTRDDPVELFWLFSSATTVVGAPGQGIYVAANAGLEALARRRQGEGLPALAIQWGAIEDAGRLAARPEQGAALARRLGSRPLPAATALSALPMMAASGVPVVACADTSWHEVRNALPSLAAPLFVEIRGSADDAAADEVLLDRLATLDGAAARALVATVLTEEVADILRLPPVDIDGHRPLAELGMDSLMAIELRLAIERRLRIDLPLPALAAGTSIATLAARVADSIAQPQPPAAEFLAVAARHEAPPPDPFALAGPANIREE